MVLELANLNVPGEEDLFGEVGEVCVLGHRLLVGGGQELAAVVGVGGPHQPDVREHLNRKSIQSWARDKFLATTTTRQRNKALGTRTRIHLYTSIQSWSRDNFFLHRDIDNATIE